MTNKHSNTVGGTTHSERIEGRKKQMARYKTMKAQRDELLEALKEISDILHGDLPITRQVKEIAKAAIAKATE